jgi:hypothetical protein
MSRLLVITVAAVALALPASAHADLLAAYDRVTPSAQLDIGLVNASTGQPVALPAGVNTAAREFHPSLSPDARRLAFVRQTFELRGSDQILQAVDRVHVVDLRTGAELTPASLVAGDDRTTTPTFAADGASIVVGHHPDGAITDDRIGVVALPSGAVSLVDSGFDEFANTPQGLALTSLACGLGSSCFAVIAKTLNPAAGPAGGVRAWELETSGGSVGERSTILVRRGSADATLPAPGDDAAGRWSHPAIATGALVAAQFERAGAGGVLAPGDLHVLDVASGTQTTDFPGINTPLDEHAPAWLADGRMLAFLRTTTAGREQLVVYDTDTAQPLNAAQADLGAAPGADLLGTLRRRQGGLSLARLTPPPTITCDAACARAIASLQVGTTGTKVGILVQREVRTGAKRPRLRFARRIPLGFHRPGRFGVRLPRLPDGTYQLVARTLTPSNKVRDVSAPVRVDVRHGVYRRLASRRPR